MTVRHHPSDATLVAYGSGSLAEGLALVVATHLALCPDCRAKAAEVEAVGGALLDTLAPVPMAEDAFAKILPRLGEVESKAIAAPRQTTAEAVPGFRPPEPLRGYLGEAAAGKRWSFLAPGLRQIAVLPRSAAGGNTQLIKVAPGTALMHHGHRGLELTVVLQGSYSDELGRFAAGDFIETDEDVRHRPVADRGQDCICLIATSGPLRFSTLAGRVMQRFIGM